MAMDGRLLGLLAGLLIAVSMAFILTRWPRHRHRSVSMHVADRRSTFLLFAVASTLSVGLLYVFMSDWLMPTLQLPGAFQVVLVAALAGQLAAAWIPCLPGRQEYWHSMAAYLMAGLLPVLLGFLLFSPVAPVPLKFFTAVAIGWMVIMLVLLLAVPRIKRLYLIFQLIYIWLFYSIIMIAAFTVG